MFRQVVLDVRNYFIAQGETRVEVVSGLNARNQQPIAGKPYRVAFVPSDSIEIIPAVQSPGYQIDNADGYSDLVRRPLLNTFFTHDVYLMAFAGTKPGSTEVTLDNMHAVYDLWEAVTRAINNVYGAPSTDQGLYSWSGATWSTNPVTQVHGAELKATLKMSIPLFSEDDPYVSLTPIAGPPKPTPP